MLQNVTLPQKISSGGFAKHDFGRRVAGRMHQGRWEHAGRGGEPEEGGGDEGGVEEDGGRRGAAGRRRRLPDAERWEREGEGVQGDGGGEEGKK